MDDGVNRQTPAEPTQLALLPNPIISYSISISTGKNEDDPIAAKVENLCQLVLHVGSSCRAADLH